MLDCRPWHPLLVKSAAGIGWCKIGNGGCWQETQDGKIYSACLPKGCHCPPRFKGDGVNNCEDIDECKEKLVCQCSDCSCKNTWGSYECNCEAGHLYIREHDTCISILSAPSKSGWTTVSFVIFAMVAASVGAYVVYKYRLRKSEQSWHSICHWMAKEISQISDNNSIKGHICSKRNDGAEHISKADSPPQNILLSLENKVNFKSQAYQSTLFVFKLGLSKNQPFLLMNGLVYPNSQEPDSAIQAMNEELVKIQEGIYYGHIGSNTDILEKFLSESGHPRYNPQIIYSGKGHQKFVSLCASVAKKDSVIMKLQYLHSPETENDVKLVTHLLAVDLTSKRGLKFLCNGIRYLLDGSRRARVGILYNMDNLDSLSEQSPPFLLMKVIDSAVSSVRDHGKALHFLNQLIVWYESQHISSSQGSDPIVSNFIEEVTKLAESSDLKSEKLKSELSVGTWDILSFKYYLQTVC